MRDRTLTDDQLDALLMESSPYEQTPAALTAVPRTVPRPARRPRSSWIAPALAAASTALVVVFAAQALAVREGPRSPAATPSAVATNAAYGPWFVEARKQVTSDFERQVLSDDAITHAEYSEAMGRYFECVESYGLTVTPDEQDDGLITYGIGGSWDDDLVQTVTLDCATGTSAVIEPLYSVMVQNPANRPGEFDGVIAACLVTAGAVDAPYTAEDYHEDSASLEFRLRMMEHPVGGDCFVAP